MKTKLTLLIIALLSGPAVMYGQKHMERDGNSYYRFEFHKTSNDSVPSLYCVITLNSLNNYKKINLSYDNSQNTYLISNILKGGVPNATFHNNKLYVLISEHLKVPYVIVTATTISGSNYDIWLKDSRGKFTDPAHDMERWKYAMKRLRELDTKPHPSNGH